jgi:hypothetical protein
MLCNISVAGYCCSNSCFLKHVAFWVYHLVVCIPCSLKIDRQLAWGPSGSGRVCRPVLVCVFLLIAFEPNDVFSWNFVWKLSLSVP